MTPEQEQQLKEEAKNSSDDHHKKEGWDSTKWCKTGYEYGYIASSKKSHKTIELLKDHQRNNCHWKKVALGYHDEIEQLKLELKAERAGNDFYAAPHRYQRGEVFFKSVLTGDHGDMEIFDDVNNCYYQVSGRMARSVQAKRVLVME